MADQSTAAQQANSVVARFIDTHCTGHLKIADYVHAGNRLDDHLLLLAKAKPSPMTAEILNELSKTSAQELYRSYREFSAQAAHAFPQGADHATPKDFESEAAAIRARASKLRQELPTLGFAGRLGAQLQLALSNAQLRLNLDWDAASLELTRESPSLFPACGSGLRHHGR